MKKPCMICGTDKVDAHHIDYTDAKTVYWLCRPHHRIFHSDLRKIKKGGSDGGREDQENILSRMQEQQRICNEKGISMSALRKHLGKNAKKLNCSIIIHDVSRELRWSIKLLALKAGKTMNEFLIEALTAAVEKTKEKK